MMMVPCPWCGPRDAGEFRQAGEVIDRRRPISFTWNGRVYQAFEGDTIISALAAAGERVFSRSLKYRRPRGLLTATFHDPGCLLQVSDEPNVRGSHRLVTNGMEVTAQAVWPSLRVDDKAANRLAGRFLTAGFYYKTFMRPKPLWPAYEAVLRRFVNAGEVAPSTPRRPRDKRHAHPDVLVAGGGPAGMAAAVAAARAGARVLLAEEDHQLGGHLRWGGEAELAALTELAAQVAAESGIEVLVNAAVLGRYDGNLVAVLDRGHCYSEGQGGADIEQLIRARANTLVVAPGQRAVVLAANADGDAAAADLRRAGVDVVRVEDARHGGDIVEVLGRNEVRAARLADGSTVECDLVVTATGWTAPPSLLNMAGNRPVYDPRAARFFPDAKTLPGDVLAAGGIAGDGTLDELLAHATATGEEAARRATAIARARAKLVPTRPGPPPMRHPPAHPPATRYQSWRCPCTRTRNCSAAAPTGSSTSARTCRPGTWPGRWPRRPRRGRHPHRRLRPRRMAPDRPARPGRRPNRQDGPRSYLLHCERPVGQYLFDALLRAGAEYGLAVDGFRPAAV